MNFLPRVVSLKDAEESLTVTGPAQVYGTAEGDKLDSLTINYSGSVTLNPNGGADVLILNGEASSDDVSGNDTLTITPVEEGTYNINAQSGDDAVILEGVGGAAVVTANGGEGNDTFYLGPVREASVSIDGGDGTADAVQLMDNSGAVQFADEANAGVIRLTDIESVLGTDGDDIIDVSDYTGDVTVSGGEGNDVITGAGTLLGDAGDDLLSVTDTAVVQGGAGADMLSLAALAEGGDTLTTSLAGNAFTVGEDDDAKTVTFDGIEAITAGEGKAFDLTVNGRTTFAAGTALEFGSGQDKLTLTPDAAGSSIRIRNFDKQGGDSIDATSLI